MEREVWSHRHSHIVIILLSALLGAAVTLLAIYGIGGRNGSAPALAQSPPSSDWQMAFVRVAERVLPAVVNISAERVTRARGEFPDIEDFFRKFFPFPFEFKFGPEGEEGGSEGGPIVRRGISLGSGWIYSPDGYIVTNSHVIEGATDIKVTLHDKPGDKRQYEAKVVGDDPRTELAVLKIKVNRRLPTLKLGDSDAARVGEWVMAVGAPFGYEQTVTVGIISAKGRELAGRSKYIRIGDVIQTDAAINPGNSGGPLVNLRGEVIGINVAIVTRGFIPANAGVGFAIPANTARRVVPELIRKGRVARGWLGITIEDLTPNLQDFYGAPEGGALVTSIQPDSPASKSDLKVDDVIVAVDGQPVHDTWELQKAIASRKPGSVVTLDVIRNRKRIKVRVKLGEMPAKYAGLEEEKPEQRAEARKVLGLRVTEVTPELAAEEDLPVKHGVVVLSVDPTGPAADVIEKGDIITRIDGKPVRNLDDYERLMKQARERGAAYVVLRVLRNVDGEWLPTVVDVPLK